MDHRLSDVLGLYPLVREDHLKTLRKCSLLEAPDVVGGERFVGFADVAVIRQVNAELQRGSDVAVEPGDDGPVPRIVVARQPDSHRHRDRDRDQAEQELLAIEAVALANDRARFVLDVGSVGERLQRPAVGRVALGHALQVAVGHDEPVAQIVDLSRARRAPGCR